MYIQKLQFETNDTEGLTANKHNAVILISITKRKMYMLCVCHQYHSVLMMVFFMLGT